MRLLIDVEYLPEAVRKAFIKDIYTNIPEFNSKAVWLETYNFKYDAWNSSWNLMSDNKTKEDAISIDEFYRLRALHKKEPKVIIEVLQSTYESLKDSLGSAKVLKSQA